jgi:hypothetical protein
MNTATGRLPDLITGAAIGWYLIELSFGKADQAAYMIGCFTRRKPMAVGNVVVWRHKA